MTYDVSLQLGFVEPAPGVPTQFFEIAKRGKNRQPADVKEVRDPGRRDTFDVTLNKDGNGNALSTHVDFTLPRASEIRSWTAVSRVGLRTAFFTEVP